MCSSFLAGSWNIQLEVCVSSYFQLAFNEQDWFLNANLINYHRYISFLFYFSKILQIAPGLKDLEIIPFVVAAYNKKLKKMMLFDPANANDYENISGTKMRTLAKVTA